MKNVFSLLVLLMSVQSAFAGYGSMTIGEYAYLPDCGGTVKVTKSSNQGSDQVNIVFNDVVNCSNFDIVGLPKYKAVKLGGENRARGGSFTIPQRAIGDGFNSIQIIIRSNSGKTDDTINVMFIADDVPSKPSNPAPSTGGAYN